MDLRPSRIAADDNGWTWLAADGRGARLRMAFWSTVLSLLLIVLAAAATLPPPLLAVPLVAAVLGAGLALATTLWNRAHSGVAVSSLGLAVRSGFNVAQVSWAALEAVVAQPVGSRVRIVVRADGAVYRTAATFTREIALRWLAECEREAARRHLRPRPAGGMAGFSTT